MFRTLSITRLTLFGLPGARAAAAELKILPADVALTGPHASQRLAVLSATGGRIDGDVTEKVKFTSSNPAVAKVDGDGTVRAAGDGEAVITATDGKGEATAKVRVAKAKEPVHWSFRNHVVPLMTKVGCNSGACHGALAGKGGLKLSLRGFDPATDHFVLTRQALARRVDRQEPERRLFLMKPTRQLPHGGGRKFPVDSAEYRLLRDWVAAGAAGPADSDARLARLEVFPPAALAKPKDRLRVAVRAWYSDGRAADVTAWARFTSSEEQVANVDDAGNVTVAGPGVATVNVGFGTLVAGVPVTVPFSNAVEPRAFAHAANHNFIDALVLRQLEALHLPPSGLCTDREFIRRAYLD